MKISIALATYNGALYLDEQLRSFAVQDTLPDELVVCDDCSSDDTVAMLEDFQRTAPFQVKLFRNATILGHEQNFGKAISLCRGEVIFLSDQDDVWLPNKIAEVMSVFDRQPNVLLTINDLQITNAQLQRTGFTVLEQIRSSGTLGTQSKSFIVGCGSAFRRKLVQILLPIPPLSYGHDKWIHDVGRIVRGRCVLEVPLQLYRRHSNNASNWVFASDRPATWAEMMKPTVGMDISPSYAKEMEVMAIMSDRLKRMGRQAYLDMGGVTPFEEALSHLDRAQNALASRINLVRSGFLMRKAWACYMLAKGQYDYFLGWRSFGKDLLR